MGSDDEADERLARGWHVPARRARIESRVCAIKRGARGSGQARDAHGLAAHRRLPARPELAYVQTEGLRLDRHVGYRLTEVIYREFGELPVCVLDEPVRKVCDEKA